MLKRLADAFPDAVAQLTLQYRMHEDICRLCNLMVYKGRLKCANDDIRSRRLLLPSFPRALRSLCNDSGTGLGWLLPVLNPNRPVVFVNTDNIGNTAQDFRGHEISHGRSREGGGIVNEVECTLTRLIVHGLQTCGLETKAIGVICPYRSQVCFIYTFFFFVPRFFS
jgi:DNA replication ATP-dependent helicase Dna2